MTDSAGGVIVRDALFSLSGLSIGLSLYAAAVHASMIRRNVNHVFYVLAKIGYVLVVGEVLKTIISKVPTIPLTTDSFLYGLGLLLAALGFGGVAVDSRSWKAGRK